LLPGQGEVTPGITRGRGFPADDVKFRYVHELPVPGEHVHHPEQLLVGSDVRYLSPVDKTALVVGLNGFPGSELVVGANECMAGIDDL